MTRLSRALPTVVFLVLLIVFIRLGFWQLDRAERKEQLEHTIERNRAAAGTSLQLASLPAEPSAWQYRHVRVSGQFDGQHQYLLDNRIYRGRAGYQVLTVLRAQGKSMLVNRGWIPVGRDRNRLPRIVAGAGPVTLSGRLVPVGPPGPLLGASGYEASGWPKVIQQLDPVKIGQQTQAALVPAVLQLDDGSGDCYVCDWPAQRGGMSADRHRAYALQWFSLAAALTGLYFLVWYRKASREQ